MSRADKTSRKVTNPGGKRPQSLANRDANKTAKHLSKEKEHREIRQRLGELFEYDFSDFEIPDFPQDPFFEEGIFRPAFSTGGSGQGSAKLRINLIILTLIMVFNEVGSDERVGEAELASKIGEIMAAIKSSVHDTGKTFMGVVDQGLELYQQHLAAPAAFVANNALSALLIQSSQSRRDKEMNPFLKPKSYQIP